MSTDFNKPVAADLESVILAQIRAGRDDQARMFEPTLTGAHSNLKIGTIRWNDSTKRDEIWDGSTWGPKATLYSISINGNAATATKWATPRLLTIGETGKNVDGSAARLASHRGSRRGNHHQELDGAARAPGHHGLVGQSGRPGEEHQR
jgi:hypothetical protein